MAKELKSPYELRKKMVALEVHSPRTIKYYEVGMGGVERLEYSAGTSGVEYSVIYESGKILQFRGNLGYEARWTQ